jgi:predicted CoA-substrate-specific enzyme activase
MFIAGCDLGSATGKVVIMNDDAILSSSVVPSSMGPEKTGHIALEKALDGAGLASRKELQFILGTGYGRRGTSFIDKNMSEITCHARGAHWMNPEVRTVIDVGGQDCKVISVDDGGKVIEFVMNDKCAAGTGKFFEMMSGTLDCSLDEFAALSLQTETAITITKKCSVFAESEVITLINSGVDRSEIAAGLVDSIVRRLMAMVYRVAFAPKLAITGGCAKNEGLVKGLEKAMNEQVVRFSDPQIIGALGAALYAREMAAVESEGKAIGLN